MLCDYDWPGNVRELENLMERVTVLRGGGDLDLDDLPESMRRGPAPSLDAEMGIGLEVGAFRTAVDRFQSDLIRDALSKSGGNKKEAAERLGLNRTTLIEKIKKLRLD